MAFKLNCCSNLHLSENVPIFLLHITLIIVKQVLCQVQPQKIAKNVQTPPKTPDAHHAAAIISLIFIFFFVLSNPKHKERQHFCMKKKLLDGCEM
jgi:hypothetical protein